MCSKNSLRAVFIKYLYLQELFTTPEGLSFWEYFSERVIQFKKVTSKLTSDELLEMVHEPLGNIIILNLCIFFLICACFYYLNH